MPRDGESIRLNGAISTLCTILKFVAASAVEAEVGALFMYVQEGQIMRLILEELGHPQPVTPRTEVGIVKGTVKIQKSRGMEMRYFYSCDQVKRGFFDVK